MIYANKLDTRRNRWITRNTQATNIESWREILNIYKKIESVIKIFQQRKIHDDGFISEF